ncbi:L,D-transpeptidase [Streptomyces sp. NPDC018057]|uniref:L,D-transpeptidase family protein n=1 Tax=unclassified Streptomyces TaxID=2593676 RepID=UPI00378DF8D1
MTEPPPVLLRPKDGSVPLGWEAIRVARFYGLQVLTRLNPPGTVVIDPVGQAVYLFVALGATGQWPPLPEQGRLTVTTSVDLPPASRRTPPGTYWLVPPSRGAIRLTNADALRKALADLLPEWTGGLR